MEIVAIPPIIVGLVELLKRIGVPDKFLPLADLIIGIGIGIVYLPGDLKMSVLYGVMAGLSAGGLYDLAKPPIKALLSN